MTDLYPERRPVPGRLAVCDECVRAVALIGPRPDLGLGSSFNAISRHPESGTDCALCERGPAEWNAEYFVQLVAERRQQLRAGGSGIV